MFNVYLWGSNTKVDIIYLDFMKAFDAVYYERLLDRISTYVMKDPFHG